MTVRMVLSAKKALALMRSHIGGRAMVARPCERALWEDFAKLSDAELLKVVGKLGTEEEVLLALNKAVPFELCE
jgi:2-hydroxychromene-2-carboxylate isomerase